TRRRRSARLKPPLICAKGRDRPARRPISTYSWPGERPVAAVSLTISLSRRRTRLRSTAVPTFLDTVKPTRTGPPTSRLRACNTKAGVGTLVLAAAATKSARCLSRSIATPPAAPRRSSGAEPLASTRAARGDHPAPAFGCHAGTKAVTALAHQLARLIGPLHGLFSAGLLGLDGGSLARRKESGP